MEVVVNNGKSNPSLTNGLAKVAPETQIVTKESQVTRIRSCRDEMDVLIRARYPIIYVVSWEEERVEAQLAKIAAARNKKLFTWTFTTGIVKHGAEQPQRSKCGGGSTSDPLTALDT